MAEAVQNILSSRLFSTRAGTIAVGAFAALLALLVLLLYLSNYRSSVQNSNAAVPVLVAQRLIPQGTSGDVLGATGGYEATEVTKKTVKQGAITDPALLRGRVALADIYPGQQLTATDFTPVAAATLGSKLTGKQRAMSIPIDATHGMTSQLVAGDRADIYANLNGVIRAILQNVLVLSVSGSSSGSLSGSSGGGGNSITFRVSPNSASRLAFASDNGEVWVILRPPTGGGVIGPNVATLQQVVAGSKVPEGK